MSRRRTKAEDIRNPEHYFKRYIACERKKEQEEDAEYYDLHESLQWWNVHPLDTTVVLIGFFL